MSDEEDFLRFVNKSENREIYQILYQEFLEGLKVQKEPIIIVFGGAPGSGKTTWRRSNFNKMENMHLHDMDEVLLQLPGYQNDFDLLGPKGAFEKWWPVAREIADQLVQYAIQSKYSILYDRTCGSEGSYFDLLEAKKLGYKIILIAFCIDPNVAFDRIREREKNEGRTVTRAILEEYRSRFSALWPYYLSFVDEAVLYDNSEAFPREIFSSLTGIKDQIRYKAFLEEGDQFRSYFLEKINKCE